MRGLKLLCLTWLCSNLKVAPYVGAWIETTVVPLCRGVGNVAPYVGAWIETFAVYYDGDISSSHPTWVRGLKL